MTDKGKIDWTDIKARVKFGGMNKNGTDEAKCKANKKAGARILASTHNSINSGMKVTD